MKTTIDIFAQMMKVREMISSHIQFSSRRQTDILLCSCMLANAGGE